MYLRAVPGVLVAEERHPERAAQVREHHEGPHRGAGGRQDSQPGDPHLRLPAETMRRFRLHFVLRSDKCSIRKLHRRFIEIKQHVSQLPSGIQFKPLSAFQENRNRGSQHSQHIHHIQHIQHIQRIQRMCDSNRRFPEKEGFPKNGLPKRLLNGTLKKAVGM